MRTSKKRDIVYNTIKNAILSFDYEVGTALPLEVDLAEKYGVSRETLRNALALLEEENLIERVRGKGTFFSQNIIPPKITFLIPRPEAIDISLSYFGVYRGVLEQTFNCNCELETRVISKSNSFNDIDWSQMFKLNQNSNVIVLGFWYTKLFPILNTRKCNVAFIADNEFPELNNSMALKNWHRVNVDMQQIARDMTLEILKQGSKRPLFIMTNLFSTKNMLSFLKQYENALTMGKGSSFDYKSIEIDNKLLTTSEPHIQYKVFLDTCKEYGSDIKPQIIILDSTSPAKEHEYIVENAIKDLKIDGILSKIPLNLNNISNIPYGILTKEFITHIENKNFFYSNCDYYELGKNIVNILLDKNKKPTSKEVFSQIIMANKIHQN